VADTGLRAGAVRARAQEVLPGFASWSRELSVLRASLLGRTDTEKSEMVKMEAEVRFIPGEELDRSSRSGWTCPTPCAAVLDRALARRRARAALGGRRGRLYRRPGNEPRAPP
jgi:hypothetical protein